MNAILVSVVMAVSVQDFIEGAEIGTADQYVALESHGKYHAEKGDKSGPKTVLNGSWKMKDGADVEKDALLYRIDPRDFQAALDQVKAQAQRDTAAHAYSRVSQHRNAVLSKDGWVAQDAADQTNSALQQAEATLSADQAAILPFVITCIADERRLVQDVDLGYRQ